MMKMPTGKKTSFRIENNNQAKHTHLSHCLTHFPTVPLCGRKEEFRRHLTLKLIQTPPFSPS